MSMSSTARHIHHITSSGPVDHFHCVFRGQLRRLSCLDPWYHRYLDVVRGYDETLHVLAIYWRPITGEHLLV